MQAKQIQIIRRPEVEKLTGLSRSTIYNLMQDGKFPKRIMLSTHAVGWLKSDIEEWLLEKIDNSRPC